MSEMDPQDVRRLGRGFLLSLPLLAFASDFLPLLAAYLLLSRIAPDLLGEAANRPALFAASIALAKLPVTLAYLLIVSRRTWTAMVLAGVSIPPPALKGGRRILSGVRDHGVDAAASVAATLIVVTRVIDPGEVQVWRFAAATAATPFLLASLVRGLSWLIRRCWRSRPSRRPQHAPYSTRD